MVRARFSRSAMVLMGVMVVVVIGVVSLLAVTHAGGEASPAEAQAAVAVEADSSAAVDPAEAKKPCRPCRDRPWCTCSQFGAARISCDPCCYDTQPYPTCFD